MKKIYYYIRRFFWYRDAGYAELSSPLNGLGIFLTVLNSAILYFGYRPPEWLLVVAILAFVFLVGIIGIIAVKHFDSQKITTSLANENNEAIQEILQFVREQKNKEHG